MKKILAIFTVLLTIFLVGCPISPAKAPEVKEFSAKDLEASGATMAEDKTINPSSQHGISGFGKRALKAAEDLNSSLRTQIEELQNAVENFPQTKKLDETINVDGENIGTYLTFTKGQATLEANAKTVNDEDIMFEPNNMTEFSGTYKSIDEFTTAFDFKQQT